MAWEIGTSRRKARRASRASPIVEHVWRLRSLFLGTRYDRSPHILRLEILIDLLLKVFVHRLQNDSLNAQAYNHINATIISIGIDWREGGYDSENFGTRIIWFRVTVEKIWSFEVLGAIYEFGRRYGLL
jgi:hypothetical protein